MKCAKTGKTSFNKRDAQTFLNSKEEKNLRIYECPHCLHWHITHKEYEPHTTRYAPKLKHYKKFKKLLK